MSLLIVQDFFTFQSLDVVNNLFLVTFVLLLSPPEILTHLIRR